MVTTFNSNDNPMPLFGCLIEAELTEGIYIEDSGKTGSVTGVVSLEQVVGLVGVFPCNAIDCRVGKNTVDSLPDDTQFPLPVFAQSSPGDNIDPYFNDENSFLFEFPNAQDSGSSMNFFLDKEINGLWVQQSQLNNTTYGIPYAPGSLCPNLNWNGFKIKWQKVLAVLGAGNYRFRVQIVNFEIFLGCFTSPPFCLSEFDCYKSDRTTKFEATYTGGLFGSIDKNDDGKEWTFCCLSSSSPIIWTDSIRIEGFFGNEETDYEVKNIKYQTGLVNKIRDEAILKFKWFSGELPFWLHSRLKIYGLFADELLVSDYNITNSDYTLNRYAVIRDGSYNPIYRTQNGGRRYSKVIVDFKAQMQNIKRTRCC